MILVSAVISDPNPNMGIQYRPPQMIKGLHPKILQCY